MIINYNPDVLTCLANLSNDEVFTPPELVNDILDLLPIELFESKETTFLDPVCKSGVFLREIAKRLMKGLEKEFPDKQKRINHIFKNQLFGIAITELTSLLSRRSVYCTKTANGKYSVCEEFEDIQGNILFKRINHKWNTSSGSAGKCKFCGASKKTYKRSKDLETHAYQFIHTEKPEELFKMKFDVIIGNPPYQLSDGGFGKSAKPIYHKFVEQAKKLNPRYLTMIIPSRWFAGGKGLDMFRDAMLNDSRITKLVDYFDSTECFSGVDLSGGVCYFLWEKDVRDECEVTTRRSGKASVMKRPLLESDTDIFVRFNEAISIFRKVKMNNELSINNQISSRKPFGLDTTYRGKNEKFKNSVTLYQNGGKSFISHDEIIRNTEWVDIFKVCVAKAYGERGAFPYLVLGKPFILQPNEVCTETYIVVGTDNTESSAINLANYVKTRFFRFLVLLKKNTQDATAKVYEFVPIQDFSKPWTDEKLYKKYGLDENEIEFIESMVRPMELNNE